MGKIDNAVLQARLLSLNSDSIPVNVRKLAKDLDITVLFENLGECSGFYTARPHGCYIVVNKDQPCTRQRWTISHELGHHALPSTRSIEYFSNRERAANTFAAELLMPENAVRLYLPQFLKSTWTETSDAMAKHFDVSPQAALFRLEELNIIENTSIDQLREAYIAVRAMNMPEHSQLPAAMQIADFISEMSKDKN